MAEISANLKSEGQKYDKILTNIEKNTQKTFDGLTENIDRAAYRVAQEKMAEIYMNGENAYNRAQKMRESLKESAAQTERGAQLQEVIDVLNNPENLADLGNRVEASIADRIKAVEQNLTQRESTL